MYECNVQGRKIFSPVSTGSSPRCKQMRAVYAEIGYDIVHGRRRNDQMARSLR